MAFKQSAATEERPDMFKSLTYNPQISIPDLYHGRRETYAHGLPSHNLGQSRPGNYGLQGRVRDQR